MRPKYKGIYLKQKNHTGLLIKLLLISILIGGLGWTWAFSLKSTNDIRLQKITMDTQTITELMEQDLIDAELNQSLTEQLIELKLDIQIPTDARTEIGRYIYYTFKEALGVEDARRALKIARCESRFDPLAMNVNNNSTVDRGIFQLNSGGVGYGYSEDVLFDPYQNIDIAREYVKEHSWGAWVCNSKI